MSAQPLIELARLALDAGERDLARRYLRQAQARDPEHLEAGLSLARLEYEDGFAGAAVEILARLWKSTGNREVGDLMAEASLALLEGAREIGRADDAVVARLAGLLKALHGGTGILVDTLQYDIVGGLAIDAIALVPAHRAGLTGRAGKPVAFFSGRSANPALAAMIGRELPYFSDPDFPRLMAYTSYDWEKARYTLDERYFEEFFGRHADLFRGVVEFTHSTNGAAYLDPADDRSALDVPWPVSFSEEEKTLGERFVGEVLGVPQGGWFVCIYARDGAYYGETPQSPNWFRNSDIGTFLPAIDEILAAGGHVVRIGEVTSRELAHPDPRVFDYSNSGLRTPFLDIYLLAHCRFLLGTPSGLCHVAYIFRTPELMVNAVNVCNIRSADLYIPKQIRDRDSGRPLPFEEFLERFHSYDDIGLFFENGVNQERLLKVRYADNSPEEIAAATREMLARLEGRHAEKEEAARRRRGFRECWLRWYPMMAETPIATSFLEAHPELF